jgi:hypothetical protein
MITRFSRLTLSFLFVPAIIAGVLGTTQQGYAQFFDDAPEPPAFVFVEKNQVLKNILDLQNQMQLLKRVIQHETAVNQMVEASVSIGLNDPQIPAPNMEVCKSLPANIPCAQAYEEMYQDFSVAKAAPAMPVASTQVSNADIPALPADALSEIPGIAEAPAATAAGIFWMDISCMSKKCSALVSADPKNPDALYRVYVGDKLEDGSTVKAISISGVTIDEKGKEVKLEPAPV